MSKKYYRFFGGLLAAQEKWLNKMATKGCRLIRTGRLLYEFEECRPGQFQYCVEFIGQKSKRSADGYAAFLEDMGCRVFYKNIDLNYSAGKLRWRPWAEKGGRIATNGTTFNRELLIVEKENDGRPFKLHTSCEDKAEYYSALCKPWLFLLLFFGLFAVLGRSALWGALALLSLIPVLVYQAQAAQNKREAKIKEW